MREGLQRDTGKSLEQWAAIARACPETTSRKRTQWLKAEHGLGVNRAATVLAEAFPSEERWDEPEALRAALWSDPAAVAILDRLERAVAALPDLTVGQRKGYTAFSRAVQFAAARPLKGGKALLGLKLEPDASPRLKPPARRESWSERLTAVVELTGPDEVDGEVERLLGLAAARG